MEKIMSFGLHKHFIPRDGGSPGFAALVLLKFKARNSLSTNLPLSCSKVPLAPGPSGLNRGVLSHTSWWGSARCKR